MSLEKLNSFHLLNSMVYSFLCLVGPNQRPAFWSDAIQSIFTKHVVQSANEYEILFSFSIAVPAQMAEFRNFFEKYTFVRFLYFSPTIHVIPHIARHQLFFAATGTIILIWEPWYRMMSSGWNAGPAPQKAFIYRSGELTLGLHRSTIEQWKHISLHPLESWWLRDVAAPLPRALASLPFKVKSVQDKNHLEQLQSSYYHPYNHKLRQRDTELLSYLLFIHERKTA